MNYTTLSINIVYDFKIFSVLFEAHEKGSVLLFSVVLNNIYPLDTIELPVYNNNLYQHILSEAKKAAKRHFLEVKQAKYN